MSEARAGLDARRWARLAEITPQRFLLLVGVPLGLVFALLAPAWTGYDESTHFARSFDIASGNVFPGDTPDGTGSLLPQTFRDDQDLVGAVWLFDGRAPFSFATVGDLLDSRPGDDRSYFFDTRPTTASTPAAYLPSAVGMAVPVALDAPLVVTLWFGRLANLAAYLVIAWFAVRLAAAFRWTLVAAALVPLNLALGATVTPDGPTIAAVLLVVAVWTRVERRVLAPRAAAIEVGAAGLLLAVCKPPYLLVLAVFPALWLVRRRDAMTSWAAGVATVVLGIGLSVSLASSSNNYRAATETLIDSVAYQPEVQRERLLDDPLGFVWTATQTWFGELDDYLQIWIRQLGFWRSDLPILAAWAVVAVVLVAALRLDADDYARAAGLGTRDARDPGHRDDPGAVRVELHLLRRHGRRRAHRPSDGALRDPDRGPRHARPAPPIGAGARRPAGARPPRPGAGGARSRLRDRRPVRRADLGVARDRLNGPEPLTGQQARQADTSRTRWGPAVATHPSVPTPTIAWSAMI